MDRREKKELRDQIGEHLDLGSARLTDDDAELLGEFIDEYDESYRGRSESRETRRTGWSSDGKYVRHETCTDTFTEDVGIRQDYEFEDDDGQRGSSSSEIRDARGVLTWLRNRR